MDSWLLPATDDALLVLNRGEIISAAWCFGRLRRWASNDCTLRDEGLSLLSLRLDCCVILPDTSSMFD